MKIFLSPTRLALIASFFIIDRVLKIVAFQAILAGGTFHGWWSPYRNTTIFFFWQQTDAALELIFLCAILLAFFMSTIKHLTTEHFFGASLFLAGAMSNLTDRMLYGGVIDYVNVGFGGRINIADAMIIAGIAWSLFSFKRYDKKIHTAR